MEVKQKVLKFREGGGGGGGRDPWGKSAIIMTAHKGKGSDTYPNCISKNMNAGEGR